MSYNSGNAGSGLNVLIGIYMFVLGLINFFPSLAVIGCGGLLGGMGALTMVGDATTAGGIVTISGIIGLALALALFVYAYGVISTKPWAYNGSIVLHGVNILFQLFSASALGFGIVQIVLIALSGGTIYLLLTNGELKSSLGR